MKRNKLNLIIDGIAFVSFIFLTTTGVVLYGLLPAGSGRWVTLWGMDRHEWGAVHGWIAILFLSVLILHLVVHGRWLYCMIRGRNNQYSGKRLALALLGLLAILAIAVAPLLSPVKKIPHESGSGMGSPWNQEHKEIEQETEN